MRAHIFQHVPFEGPGCIADWLTERDAEVGYTHFHAPYPRLPELDGLDLLVVMGGPMSVNDEPLLPWLVMEKRFIASAILRGTPVLGICLGAQLMANALGARVYAHDQREIGWFPIEAMPCEAPAFAFPSRVEAFHWHGETFDLPAGAVHLARSAACAHQAFQIGARAIGLQCHLETTPASAEALISHCGDELRERGVWIQAEDVLRARLSTACAVSNRLMADVLDYLTRP